MAQKSEVLFHIGLPKAASTTVQKHLFPYIPDVNNFSLYPTNNVAGSNRIPKNINSVYLQDKRLVEFYKTLHNKPDINAGQLSRMWGTLSDAHSKYPKTLLSHEAITSYFFSAIPVEKKLLRIKEVFPNAKVCIVIRNQNSWLHSQYTDHPFTPTDLGKGAPCLFNDWVDMFLHHPSLSLARKMLDYYQLVCQCRVLFGEENITVMKLDWLINDPHLYYASWAKFLGIRYTFVESKLANQLENRGLPRLYNDIRQKARENKLQGKSNIVPDSLLRLSLLKSLPKAKYTMSPQTERSLDQYYADSNNKLNALMGW